MAVRAAARRVTHRPTISTIQDAHRPQAAPCCSAVQASILVRQKPILPTNHVREYPLTIDTNKACSVRHVCSTTAHMPLQNRPLTAHQLTIVPSHRASTPRFRSPPRRSNHTHTPTITHFEVAVNQSAASLVLPAQCSCSRVLSTQPKCAKRLAPLARSI